MSIAPATLAILLAPWIALHALRQERCVRTTLLLWMKMVPATVISTVASLTISAVIYAHHLHNLQSSALSSTYISMAMLLDATKSRSFFSRDGLAPLGAVTAVTAGLKLAMLLVEEIPKTRLILYPSPHIGRESTSGFWGRLCFLWVNPLLTYGYGHDITVDDIGGLGPEFAAELLHGRFSRRWCRTMTSSSGLSLAMVCFWCMPLAFLAIIIPQLCSTGLAFSQPFIVQRVIAHLQGSASSSSPQSGNALIGATVLAFVGFAVTNNFGKHMSYRLLAQIRGALITELFAKCSRLSMREAKKISVVTLMTADIEGIALALAQLYVIPLSFFQAGLGMYLLSLLVSYSFVLVVVPLVISVLSGYYLGTSTATAFGQWNTAIEHRVKETSNVLSQLTSTKMNGLGPTMVEFLETQRAAEMTASIHYRNVLAWLNFSLLFVDIGTPAVLFAGALFWTGLGGVVNAKQVFPALAIVGLVQHPLALSIQSYGTVMTMMRSLGRIQEFFCTEENKDTRVIGHESTALDIEKSVLHSEAGRKVAQMEKHQESSERTCHNNPVVEFANVDITPAGHDTAILRNVNFTAAQGSLTVAVGAVGSGKSTFLHSVIGEAEVQQGVVSIDREGPVGYCDQHVWLRNTSIQDNVVGPSSFDQDRYDRIIGVCRLKEDIEQFPEGDRYIIGSNGSNLSGGQRQRLSLARALYLEAHLMVLDDIFSALDHPTAMAIFSGLFGENGILRQSRCTVILSTHLPECLDEADQVLVFDGKGKVSTKPAASDTSDMSTKDAQLLAKASSSAEVVDFRGVSKVGLYGMLLKSMGIRWFCLYLVMQMAMSALELLPAPANKLYYIGYASLAVFCAVFGAFSFWFYYTRIVPRSAMALHRTFSETVMRYSQDMTILARLLPGTLSFVLYSFFALVVQYGAILASSKWMSIVVAGIIITACALQYYYLRTSRQMRHFELDAHTPLYTEFLEISSGLRHIRAFGWEEEFLKESYKLIDTSQKPFYMLYSIQRWLGFVLDCKIEFEDVTARYKYGPSCVIRIGNTILTLLMYTNSPDDGDKIALRNVSFIIAPGQNGKSSVILTLLGFLNYSGKILIDGVDVSTIAPDELRARLITISQHSIKFSGTVRDNLLPFQINETSEQNVRARDEEAKEELVRLNIWEIVQEKGGLDSKLEDVGLSSGQLQMLCIARAILRNQEIDSRVVLVDEGTSNIDYETDAAIQTALKEAFADCTVITIAHRTNTIDDCDVQIELSKGEIVTRE
ncbi:ABC transporter, transmembrane domain, type 1 [Akanthomyces lecanii RCEF 1005]|uniref:ABC transporter, transmembrane domain, type 1 n=1 Tax=Akanthomyces lecanii RCEF 1005 TaxID=1081108 RepID=A0A168I0Q4_CORDF|nr:ABC transporter, transmembrane domain, type 1 [Akanthomyces lecanii RCEF 1005]